jgi:CRISPR system Cascade subunit CasE
LGEEAQVAWLRRKMEAAGLELVAVRQHDEGMRHGSRKKLEDERRMTFVSVLYEGVVRVMDTDRAMTAVQGGVGSAKAFGFGLLSIARR